MELQIKEPLLSILKEKECLDSFIENVMSHDLFDMKEFNECDIYDQLNSFVWHKSKQGMQVWSEINDLLPELVEE